MKKTKDLCETLYKMKEKGLFNNYIEYIQFINYKNMEMAERISFEFPFTVLIGKNGAGKSSTLHALYGAPSGYSCGDFWFSTSVDPIEEKGGRAKYFYGYKEDKYGDIKEVKLHRAQRRETEVKKEDKDYWETARATIKEGMMPTIDRNAPVDKQVIYIDFRAEVSAFDKILHFSYMDKKECKDFLRKSSIYLKRLFDGEAIRMPGNRNYSLGNAEKLDLESTKIASEILNKEYSEIRIADHRIYKLLGTSIFIKTENSLGYSEANAGSGEIAVIQLIRKIQKSKDYALILLDEPEVSLHPAAQKKMKEYLLTQAKNKKLQIIVSTHSFTFVEGLPNRAIKLFKTNINGKFYVQTDVNYQEAFFDIEEKALKKKQIYCEDAGAKSLIERVLSSMNKKNYFEIHYFSGGEEVLLNHYLTAVAMNRNLWDKIYIWADGDKDTGYRFNEETLTVVQLSSLKYLKNEVKKVYGIELKTFPDKGDGGKREDQMRRDLLEYLRFSTTNMMFFPDKKIPEEIILSSKFVAKNYEKVLRDYDCVNSKNAKRIMKAISKNMFNDDEHYEATFDLLCARWEEEDSEYKEQIKSQISYVFEE